MARTTSQPATATRRNTRTPQPDTNRLSPLDEQNQDSRTDGNDERREGLSAVHDEQNTDRDNSSDERGFGENRNRERESTSRNERDEYNEEGTRREQRPATLAVSMDTFAPMLEAWKQVFKSWSELTETMVKMQQDAFASMASGANAHTKELSLGENRNGERALSGPPMASTPERIDRDRR
jgi:hypothetical protein